MKLIDFSTSSFSVSTRGWVRTPPNWIEIVKRVNNQQLRGFMSVVALNSHCHKLDIYLIYRGDL